MNKKTKNFSDLSKKQKDKIISDCCEGANEEQAKLLLLLELTEKEKEKENDKEQAKQAESYLSLVKEIIRLKYRNDDEPTKADYYAKGYRDGMKETLNTIIEALEEQYKQIK